MPSVGDLLFVVLLVLLLFTPLSLRLLGDAGTGWHIRTGQQILATHAVPRVDPFSSLMHGKPWFAWEWLYDVVVGGLETWAGLNAVVWFTALVIATVFAVTFHWLVRRGTHFLIALSLVLLAISASMIHFLARPHVVSWLFTLIWLLILDASEKLSREQRPRTEKILWLLPLLMVIWVNVHGGFLVGFVLLGIYWCGAVIQWFKLKDVEFNDFLNRLQSGRHVRELTIVGMIATLATLINPYGWRLHRHIYQYLSDRFLMNHIEEFQSPNFHGAAERCFAALVLLGMVALATRARKVRLSEGLVALFAIYSGLYASRNIPVASILLVLVIGSQFSGWFFPSGFWQRMGVVESSARGYLWPIAAIVITGWIVAHGGRWGTHPLADAHFDAKRFPVQAVTYLEEQKLHGPVLSPDAWGGYLIFRFTREQPGLRVVLDDRHDLYGDAIFKSYLKMVRVEPGWDDFMKQHEAGCLLLPQGSPLSNIVLLTGEWKTIYSDDVAIAFVRADVR